MTTYNVNIRLEEGERVSACAHDHGGISISGGYSDGSLGWSVVIPYEATMDVVEEISRTITKAHALRAIHQRGAPPCEPAPATTDDATPATNPDVTGEPAGDT